MGPTREGRIRAGRIQTAGKNGSEVWIYASYNPIFDIKGKPYKVIKFASDITESKRRNAEFEGKVNAIGRAQAVIEFNLDGTTITANDNFLNTVGFTLAEIQGQHHRIFCDEHYAKSDEYKAFWQKLGAGKYDAGEYKRRTKNGSEIWLNATYNPILMLRAVHSKSSNLPPTLVRPN